LTFRPWLANPHLQTLLGSALRALQRPLRGRHELIETPDQDVLPALWSARPGPLTLVVIHGVGGHHLAREGVSLGRRWQFGNLGSVLLFSLRGASRPPLQPHLYHGGCTPELDVVYAWALRHSPNARIVMVGLSLGANLLVKWLAQSAHDMSRLAGAVAISNPWDLKACCDHLEGSFMGRFYRAAMVDTLKKRGLAVAHRYPQLLCARAIQRSVTFFDYDSVVTAPLHGFSDAMQYYDQSSSAAYLGQVTARLTCLEALDDPFVPDHSLPQHAPDSVRFVRPAHGGHLGFIAEGGQLWMEEFVCRQAADWL